MENVTKDRLLTLLQIENHHRQRIDSVWTQYKDAIVFMHSGIFAVLALLIAVPDLSTEVRITIVGLTVLAEGWIFYRSRIDAEKSAALMQAGFVADYRALTGMEPPRMLYSRALKMTAKRDMPAGDASILPASGDHHA